MTKELSLTITGGGYDHDVLSSAEEFAMMAKYNEFSHRHRFAAWAAGTAARASKKNRFSVRKGVAILEAAGFNADFGNPSNLPSASDMDSAHRQWREKVIVAAHQHGKVFTHGVAAKLINAYLKALFVCGPAAHDPRVQFLHPPIDRVLLKALADGDVGGKSAYWRMAENRGWSNFDTGEYETVIEQVRALYPEGGYWRIEQYWQGFQGND
ncbi:MAG: hypothetical protein WCG80_15950 [Spirochaetales bacterium]